MPLATHHRGTPSGRSLSEQMRTRAADHTRVRGTCHVTGHQPYTARATATTRPAHRTEAARS